MARKATTPSFTSDHPQHLVKMAHPDEMATVLDAATSEGWHLITIVPCRHSHEHAAYFSRPRLTSAPV